MQLTDDALVQSHAEPPTSFTHQVAFAVLGLFLALSVAFFGHRRRRASSLANALAQGAATKGTPPPSPLTAGEPTTAAPSPPESGAPHPADSLPPFPERAQAPVPPPKFPEMASPSQPREKWRGTLKVCRIFDEATSVKTFRLAAQDRLDLPFTYFPGQFLTLSASIDGETVRRSYTIASSPTQAHYVSVTVKREDQGVFSRFLHDSIKEGDTLDVSGPNGKFTFSGSEAESIVLIAGGVGITPMMSVIRYLADIGWSKPIYLRLLKRSLAHGVDRGSTGSTGRDLRYG
jgi:hypothetical protein